VNAKRAKKTVGLQRNFDQRTERAYEQGRSRRRAGDAYDEPQISALAVAESAPSVSQKEKVVQGMALADQAHRVRRRHRPQCRPSSGRAAPARAAARCDAKLMEARFGHDFSRVQVHTGVRRGVAGYRER
jgi:hypothetical protein